MMGNEDAFDPHDAVLWHQTQVIAGTHGGGMEELGAWTQWADKLFVL